MRIYNHLFKKPYLQNIVNTLYSVHNLCMRISQYQLEKAKASRIEYTLSGGKSLVFLCSMQGSN